MIGNTANSQARIDNSIKIPDYFSCYNCKGNQHYGLCKELRLEGNCRQQFLGYALQSGQVQIVLYLENGVTR